MKIANLVIQDEVNVKFVDLDPFIRRKIVDKLKFMVPHARHLPSFKLGRWDGMVSFATVGGATYLNLLDRVLPILIKEGYDIQIDDRRRPAAFEFPEVTEDYLADTVWPEGHVNAGEPIVLRDYQVEAINRYLENTQSLQSISTGAGKTIITAALSKITEKYGRSIVIVPSKDLVLQTEEDFQNLGLDVGVYFGDRKEFDKTHTIMTWQSLGYTSKNFKHTMDSATLDRILKDVVCVQIDEVHSAKGAILQNLLSGPLANVPLRWGLSGTIPKEEYEFLSILSTIGPIVGEIRAADLQDLGVLANCNISVLQTVDDMEFKTYDEEYAYLSTDKTRVNWIAQKIVDTAESGNTLVLVDRIETGNMLQSMIPGSVFISGKIKSKDRKKEYKEIQTADSKIIIATFGVASTGINIPRLFNLFMLDAGKSFQKIIQSIGRVLRKANDKDAAEIYDLCSTCKYSARHLGKRKIFYREADYPFDITKIKYR